MTHDYLWDREGPPDPLVQRLERTLDPLRADLSPPAPRTTLPRRLTVGALAALVLLAISAAIVWYARPRPAPLSAWTYQGLVKVIENAKADGVLLQVDVEGQAAISHPSGASALIGKDSRLLLRTDPHQPALELYRGTLFVQAPGGSPPVAITLPIGAARVLAGTAAQIQLTPGDLGGVQLKAGRVELTDPTRTLRVGPGMFAPLHQTVIGTPHAGRASDELRQALAKLDATPPGTPRAELLARVLERCTADDQPTLWNLARNAADPAERDRVMKRASQVVKFSFAVDDEGFERWWESFDR